VEIIECGFVFTNTQLFSHFVWTEWGEHMQVCSEDLCNFFQFTILALSFLWIILLTPKSKPNT